METPVTPLRRAFGVIWRQRILVVIVAVLFGALGAAYAGNQSTRFQATAQVLLTRQDLAFALTNTSQAPYDDQQEALVNQTQAVVAASPPVVEALFDRVQHHETLSSFQNHGSVTVASGTDILTFQDAEASPKSAQRVVNAWTQAYLAYRQQLDSVPLGRALSSLNRSGVIRAGFKSTKVRLQLLKMLDSSNATVIHPSTAATQVAPRLLRTVLLALIGGLMLGVAAAAVRESVDDRVRDPAELSSLLSLAPLGYLPTPQPRTVSRVGSTRTATAGRDHVLASSDPIYARSVEALKGRLGTALTSETSTLMLTGLNPGTGTTTTALTLGNAYAAAGWLVVMIDLDFAGTGLTRALGLESHAGSPEVIAGKAEVDEALVMRDLESTSTRRGEPRGMYCLGAGHGSALPQADELADLMDAVKQQVHHLRQDHRLSRSLILLDAPAILDSPLPFRTTPLVDAVAILTRLGSTSRGQLVELVSLAGSASQFIGFIMTNAGRTRLRSRWKKRRARPAPPAESPATAGWSKQSRASTLQD